MVKRMRKRRKVVRDARTGKFAPKSAAEKRPATTETETVER